MDGHVFTCGLLLPGHDQSLRKEVSAGTIQETEEEKTGQDNDATSAEMRTVLPGMRLVYF